MRKAVTSSDWAAARGAHAFYAEGVFLNGLGRCPRGARLLCRRRFPQRAAVYAEGVFLNGLPFMPKGVFLNGLPFMPKAFSSTGWAAARGAHAVYAEGTTTFG
jgi:hypothetical protein